MSSIGTVYELNLKTRMKNLYPVVYENRDYYVCKVHGCSGIKTFLKASSGLYASFSEVVPYATFKKFYEDEKYENWHKVFVFVKTGEAACFEPFMQMTSEERKMEALEKKLNDARYQLERVRSNFEFVKNAAKKAEKKVNALEKEKANLEKIMQKKKLEVDAAKNMSV